MYRMPDGHYFFDQSGYRMIVVDTNYYYVGGEYIHYNLGNYYANGAYRDYVPPQQLEWLEKTIEESPYPCILISHASFERKASGVKNQQAVRRIINEANRRKKHSVLMCINGHYHRDHISILDGVLYLDMNSVCYDWVPIAHNCYPEELCSRFRCLKNTVVYNDPLYAVVTVQGSTVTIEGVESSMFMGINREHTENPVCDPDGREVVPRVQSAKITLG